MNKNKGFSLIELIVVIAIMAIITSLVGISFYVLSSQKVKSAASDVKSLLQASQMVAMSKDDCYIEFTTNGDGDVQITSYSSLSKKLDQQVLGNGIAVKLLIGSTEYTVSKDHPIKLQYVRSSGAFKKAVRDGLELDYCTKIIFTKGDKEVKLALSTLTGKVSYDN